MVTLHRVDHDPFADVKEITVIRHGATAFNNERADEKLRGWIDMPLSQKGRQEVAETAQKLAATGLQLIVHSDLMRAAETAQIIAFKTHAETFPSPFLRTWNIGKYAGQDAKRFEPALKKYMIHGAERVSGGGESFDQFKVRALFGLEEAISIAGPRRLGIVTHRFVERFFELWVQHGQRTDFKFDPDAMCGGGNAPANFHVLAVDVARLHNPHGIGRSPTMVPVEHDPFGA